MRLRQKESKAEEEMENTLGVFKAKLSALKVSDQTRSKEFWILAMNFKDHFLSRSCISVSYVL